MTRQAWAMIGLASLLGAPVLGAGPADAATFGDVDVTCDLPTDTAAPACDPAVWLAWVPDAMASGCPPISGLPEWEPAPLFDAIGFDVPGLAPFCRYVWLPAGPPPPGAQVELESQLTTLHAAEGVVPDCAVIAPQASVADLSDAALGASFAVQAGLVGPLPMPLPDAGFGWTPTRVAVVDSAVSFGPLHADQSGHGTAVAAAVQRLGCPNPGKGACATNVSAHLALPYVLPGVQDTANGGFFGDFTSLSTAIADAVLAWKMSAEQRLVVNLSVGWASDPQVPSTDVSGPVLPATARAVHAAITHAVCSGALVVAAAGNQSHGPSPASGPLYPGGWEALAMPTPEVCASFMGPPDPPGGPIPPWPGPPDVYAPLVHAVGGVDARGEAIHLTRPASTPRLVAPGHQVMGSLDALMVRPDAPLSGTSMAAAAASGVAAATWAYTPWMFAPELMELVHVTGLGVAGPAAPDVCLGGGPCKTHPVARVRLCQALRMACMAGGCASTSCLGALPALARDPELPDAARHAIAMDPDTERSSQWMMPVEGCPAGAPCASPVEQCVANGHGKTWVDPQPTVPPCGACELTIAAASASASLRRGWLTLPAQTLGSSWRITHVTLRFSSGDEVIALPTSVWTDTERAKVVRLTIPCGSDSGSGHACNARARGASLSGVVGTRTSGSVQVLVRRL